MSTTSENNKRIAKNTLMLYARLFITMAVGLFTSRVILKTLGISDYGINNVVAGFVSMFSLLTTSLSGAISRFINVTLGEGDEQKLNTVFSTSVTIIMFMAIAVIMIAEPISVWFLNTQLNIPDGRMYAANWVLQFSLISFVVNLISVPYNATIIAHEKMNIYAYMSILDVSLKLAIVYMLYISPFDKLITYSFLFLCVGVVDRIIYGIYCGRHFKEAHYKFIIDKSLIKEMGGFAGWQIFSGGTYMINTQGINILSNIYFGVTVNAARGIVNQVENVVKQFVTSFTTAINPQIMKSYASNNIDYFYSLIYKSSKYCYFLMLLFLVPFMFEAEFVMKLWLNNYPPDAPVFLRLSLIGAMFDLLGNSLAYAAWATGRIKKYYLYVGTTLCFVFPLSWACFSIGWPAYTSYAIFALLYLIVIIFKVRIVSELTGMPKMTFCKEVLLKVTPVTIVSFILPAILYFNIEKGIINNFIVIFVSLVSVTFSIYTLGMKTSEKNLLKQTLKNKIDGIIKQS